MTVNRAGSPVAVLSILLLASCAPGLPTPVSGSNACRLNADTAVTALDTVVVALPGPFRPDSLLHPKSLAERFVARHLRANLVSLDCSGTLQPELATKWKSEAGGTSWVFTLRAAREDRITPELVRAEWDARRNGGIWPWPSVLEVEVVDSLRLRVRLDRPYPELPAEFADPALGVKGGSFRYQYILAPSAGPVTTTIYLVPVGDRGPVIKVEALRSGVDARDALDYPKAVWLSPADVIITRDAATVAYARSRKEFTVGAVAWDRSYVLLTPGPAPATALAIRDETRQGLLNDVVPGEVRAASPPFWWDSVPCLATFRFPNPDPNDGPLIAFVGSDPVARALAQRLAAVAMTHAGPRTVSMDSASLDFARLARRPTALILSLPRQRPISCDAVTRWPPGSRIDPLVDLRTFAIVRRGVPPLIVDGDGMIRLVPSPAEP